MTTPLLTLTPESYYVPHTGVPKGSTPLPGYDNSYNNLPQLQMSESIMYLLSSWDIEIVRNGKNFIVNPFFTFWDEGRQSKANMITFSVAKV